MSNLSKQDAQKKSKLSRSKTLAKKDVPKLGCIQASSLFTGMDLNETGDFKEPMTFKRDVDRADQDKQSKGNLNNKLEFIPYNAAFNGTTQIGPVEVKETMLCQLCNKDISHMNSIRREQHANRCIDKMEETQREKGGNETKPERSNRVPILECPMCKKAFKSAKARQAHLKRCASINNITTEEMLKLVKIQELESENLQLSENPQLHKAGKLPNVVPTRKRKIKEPKSQFDEDVQLALAVSSSLANQQKTAADILEDNLKGVSGPNKRRKKKKVLEDVCLLTTLSAEDRSRRVEQKLHTILVEEDSEVSDNESTPPFLGSSLKATHTGSQEELWPKANHGDDTGDIMNFYVPSLMPPISTNRLQAGSRLKRLSSIPGRNTTFASDKQDSSVKYTSHTDDMFTASTQTAVVLAELAVEDAAINETLHSSADISSLQASGFCEERLAMVSDVLDESRLQTLAGFKQMVNQSAYSDLTVTTADGSQLHAHKLVVLNRCPKLTKLMETSSSSSLSLPISKEACLVFLTYLYTGELQCSVSVQQELVEMANKKDMPSLKHACSVLTSAVRSADEELTVEDTSEEVHASLQPVMNMKDIWGESDSDGEDPVLNKQKEGTDTECELDKREPICEEDYQDIRSTQKKCHLADDKHIPLDKDSSSPQVLRSQSKSYTDVVMEESNEERQNTKSEVDHQELNNSPLDEERMVVQPKRSASDQSCLDLTGDVCLSPFYADVTERESPKHSVHQPDTPMEREPGLTKQPALFQTFKSDVQSIDVSNMNTSGVQAVDISNMNTSGIQTMDVSNINTSGMQAMDTSNIDLFESPSSPVSRLVSNMQNTSPTPNKSPLFINKRKTHASLNSKHVFSEVINVDPESDNETRSSTNKSGCITREKSDKYRRSNNCNVKLFDDYKDSSMKINNEASKPITLSPGSVNGESKYSDEDRLQTEDIDEDRVTDSELQITDDNFDEILTQSERKKELKYLGTPVSTVKSLLSGPREKADDNTSYDTNPIANTSYNGAELISMETGDRRLPTSSGYIDDMDVPVSSTSMDEDQRSENDDEVMLISCDDATGCHGDTDCKGEGDSGSQLDISHNFDWDGADVWEDFDDCGIGYSSIPSPVLTNKALPNKQVQPANRFKTPTTSDSNRQKKKKWIPPSPFTPMPQYDQMNTPALKKEVKKYGVKPVGKKRMVTVLKDIYQQTHQYETDSEFEDDPGTDANPLPDAEDIFLSQNTLTSSQESETSDLMEESILLGESTSDSDTQNSPQKGVDIKSKLHSFITTNQELHHKVLMYEPLEVDVLKANLKEAAIKCSMDKLLEFLDEKCIAFTSKNSRNRKPSRRGKKKAAPKP